MYPVPTALPLAHPHPQHAAPHLQHMHPQMQPAFPFIHMQPFGHHHPAAFFPHPQPQYPMNFAISQPIPLPSMMPDAPHHAPEGPHRHRSQSTPPQTLPHFVVATEPPRSLSPPSSLLSTAPSSPCATFDIRSSADIELELSSSPPLSSSPSPSPPPASATTLTSPRVPRQPRKPQSQSQPSKTNKTKKGAKSPVSDGYWAKGAYANSPPASSLPPPRSSSSKVPIVLDRSRELESALK